MWSPASEQPIGGWHVTRREGEAGFNVTQRIQEDEWADLEGRTTVTHGTFAPPTEFMPEPIFIPIFRRPAPSLIKLYKLIGAAVSTMEEVKRRFQRNEQSTAELEGTLAEIEAARRDYAKVEITPAMLKAAWVEFRKTFPHGWGADKEPVPGFAEALKAALKAGGY